MFRNKYNKETHVHFIGIGGIGMSGIAHVLLSLGYQVSGSDLVKGSTVLELEKLGAEIYIGHKEENISGATVVVYSSAVRQDNPEMVSAKEKGIPVIKRAEMLSELMRLKYGVAVAGSHGKTTTTSFLATMLHEAGMDPTHIIGGIVENLGGHANLGKGDFLVVEADESDGTFLLLTPVLSVITNIDNDHLDFYEHEENLLDAFVNFSNKVPFYGCCAINIHDANILKIREKIKRPTVTFGIGEICDEKIDYMAKEVSHSGHNSEFNLYFKDKFIGLVSICLPGKHNVLNALGAIALSHQMEVPFDKIILGIKKFKGVYRRFEKIYSDNIVTIIDDYAHHPTEIQSTLEALREITKDNITVIFEPHRFSRTKKCWEDFFHCFNAANKVYMAPIYAASESELHGINTERLVSDINKIHPGLVECMDELDNLYDFLNDIIKSRGGTIITLGAGSIGRKIRQAVAKLRDRGLD